MRRLPIYFLIDVSESMVGEQIQYVEDGLSAIIRELKTDPYALETAWISVLVFAGQARTLVPLREVISFYPPRFPIGGGTSLTKGLGHLMYELRKNTIATTATQKGDWKPIVFLFTDGSPTDDTSAVIREWKEHWQNKANLIAISFGEENNLSILKELTDTVLLFKNTSAQSYREFFRWITASVKSSSLSISNNGSGIELAKLTDDSILTKIDVDKLPPAPRTEEMKATFLPWGDVSRIPYTVCGPYLKELFDKAFITGLHDPALRPTADEWEQALIKTADLMQPCQNKDCDQQWFVFDNTTRPCCPFCNTPYQGQLPFLNLYWSRKAGSFTPENHRLMVYHNQYLYQWHVNRNIYPNERLTDLEKKPVGYFVFHQNRWQLVNQAMTLLRDLTEGKDIPVNSMVELTDNKQLLLSSEEGGRLIVVQLVNH